MTTTYFPSAFLMLIPIATTIFKPLFFEAALRVTLTTMLVITTTIFMGMMELESLPPTFAPKMILCQLAPIDEVREAIGHQKCNFF